MLTSIQVRDAPPLLQHRRSDRHRPAGILARASRVGPTHRTSGAAGHRATSCTGQEARRSTGAKTGCEAVLGQDGSGDAATSACGSDKDSGDAANDCGS